MKSTTTQCDICLKEWKHEHGGPPSAETPAEILENHWISRALNHNVSGLGYAGPSVSHVCGNCVGKAARLVQKFVATQD